MNLSEVAVEASKERYHNGGNAVSTAGVVNTFVAVVAVDVKPQTSLLS